MDISLKRLLCDLKAEYHVADLEQIKRGNYRRFWYILCSHWYMVVNSYQIVRLKNHLPV